MGSVVYNLLGGGADKKVKLAKLASPVTHVTKDDPPILIFHGDKDQVIPVENSISIYEALEPKNKRVLLTIYEGVGHDSWTETYENQDVYEWLIKYTH